MNEISKQKIKELIERLKTGKIEISVENYPTYLEDFIQTAVEFKRNGYIDEAIGAYLKIFEVEGKTYSGILVFLYKVLLIDCDFDEAYEIICLAEKEMVIKIGPLGTIYSPWGQPVGQMPWIQTDHKNRLTEAMINVFKDNLSVIKEYCKSASGNPNYQFPMADEILRAYARLFVVKLVN